MEYSVLGPIRWRVHLASSPESAFDMLATAQGRARFWAESAMEIDGKIHFEFPNGMTWRGEIVASERPWRFQVRYFGDSLTTFELADDGSGGTDLTLTDEGVPVDDRPETLAGWVSVLLAFKAAVDHGVDLRNHDPERTWDQGYADN
jgi:uncharacterized protein YndB with AHSA1/START domain